MPKLSDKTALTTLADGDLIHAVDVSDTTSSAAGTSKKIVASDMKTYMADYELIETAVASTDTSIDFVLPSGYTSFKVIASGIQTTTGGTTLYFRTSSDGGSTFGSGASDYSYNHQRSGAGTTTIYDAITTFIELSRTSLSDGYCSTVIYILSATDSSVPTDIHYNTHWKTGGASTRQRTTGVGVRDANAIVDAIRLLPSSSTFAIGTFKLYGIK